MKRAAQVALCGVVLTLAAFVFDASPLFVPGIAFLSGGQSDEEATARRAPPSSAV